MRRNFTSREVSNCLVVMSRVFLQPSWLMSNSVTMNVGPIN